MYDPLGEMKKMIKSGKKCPALTHEHRPHVDYFVNQIE